MNKRSGWNYQQKILQAHTQRHTQNRRMQGVTGGLS